MKSVLPEWLRCRESTYQLRMYKAGWYNVYNMDAKNKRHNDKYPETVEKYYIIRRPIFRFKVWLIKHLDNFWASISSSVTQTKFVVLKTVFVLQTSWKAYMQVIYKLQNTVSIKSFINIVNTSFSQLYLIPFKKLSIFSHSEVTVEILCLFILSELLLKLTS